MFILRVTRKSKGNEIKRQDNQSEYYSDYKSCPFFPFQFRVDMLPFFRLFLFSLVLRKRIDFRVRVFLSPYSYCIYI